MKRIFTAFAAYLFAVITAPAQTGHFFSSDLFSSSLISSFSQDRQGALWIGTDYGLNRFDGYRFQTFLHDDADTTTLVTNVVVSLLNDREGRLWVGTNRGLDRFDAPTETFIHYPFPDGIHPRVSCLLQRNDGSLIVGTAGYGAFEMNGEGQLQTFSLKEADEYFSRLFEDSRGRLWKNGFDEAIDMRQGGKVEHFQSLKGNAQRHAELGDELLILCQHGFMSYRNGRMTVADIDMGAVANDIIFTDMVVKDDYIYVGTRGRGIYRLSKACPRRLEPVTTDVVGIDLRTAKISDLFIDRRGDLWLGCHRKGLVRLSQTRSQFSSWNFEPQGISIGSHITSVCEGDGGMVWCTVQDVGVYGFNQQGRIVAHPPVPDAVEFIFRDKLRRYWLGTDNGLFAYDPLTGRSQQKVTFDCDSFNDMTSDADGNIYISTFSRGFCVYNPATGILRNYSMCDTDSIHGRLCNNWVMAMSANTQGLIWMATSSGVACFEPSTGSFLSQGWQVQLDGIVCFDVCELHAPATLKGCIAIGTEQGLYIYKPKTRQAERFPGSEVLANKAICYIVQGNDGDVWCSTSDGIWQYAVNDGAFIAHINGNGLTKKEYIYGVGMHTDDDKIFFGHNDGLTVFMPADVKQQAPTLDTLQLTAFRAGDQYVDAATVLNGVRVTDRAVSKSNFFTLSYLDHTVTLAFSQFNFVNPLNVTLEYRVNGGAWVSNTPGQNEFALGHLQPGTYRIEVRANQGGAYSPVKVLIITIRAPWYRSTAACLIYMLLLLAIGAYVFYTLRRKARRQLNEEKMKFLINTTHDIRSPLTLILAALKKLDANPAVETIDHNARRILNLVNQILDVRKIDKQQLQLHCQQTDMVPFVSGICKMFEYNAQERNIRFEFQHDGIDSVDAWVDCSQFDKVVTNLLSNAFKYTADGGEVTVVLKSGNGAAETTGAQLLTLQVIDNGTGLDSDSIKHIFDRFYQGSNSRYLHVEGTGIGLNLCKMIVDMHHGTIEAANRTDTTGSVFTVTLPLGNSHLKPEEIEAAEPSHGAHEAYKSCKPYEPQASYSSSRRRVLLVDDDEEIGRYIANELGHFYKFTIRYNGKAGLKELLTGQDYDAVVSDVMMPEMDGFTMLRMIKTNLNISQLPVIMLTSKADVGNRLEGLERGADAFLAKPFDMEELHMYIDNLIHQRLHLKGKYSGAQKQAELLEQPEVKGNDELLMERIMKAVNKNLSNSDFNVDMLTQEVGISRAQLHRKMKGLTGISTSEFIRNIRLEQAARLLKEQKVNITQVAYAVGFSNLAHFSTVFRKHFGVSPSEYAEREE